MAIGKCVGTEKNQMVAGWCWEADKTGKDQRKGKMLEKKADRLDIKEKGLKLTCTVWDDFRNFFSVFS